MAQVTYDIAIQLMKDLWRKDTTYELDDADAKKYFKTGLYHVELIDYPQNNTWTLNESDNEITFTTIPSDDSYMLYIYRGLLDLFMALYSGKVEDEKLGVAWRSGMETISTATGGRLQKSLGEDFQKRYDTALTEVKTNNHSIWRYDIYGDLTG